MSQKQLSVFTFFFLGVVSHYVAQAGLKLVILLSQPPECWDYRCAPPRLLSVYIYILTTV
jgi:hypothetical protein